jgi:integrase
MARNKLNATQVRAATKPGVLGDGDGLYLRVGKQGAKSWIFVWRRRGRRHEMGLGGATIVSLAAARTKAEEARAILGRAGDPWSEMAERRSAIERTTFGECADDLIASMESGWQNGKHRDQWRMTLKVYAEPLRSMPVADVTTDDVVRVLRPLWTDKQETGSRLRGRVERVLSHAKARGLRHGENPARWKGHLDHLLAPRQKLARGHHPALPYADAPLFMAELREREGVSASALEFTILTAARTGESIAARWPEIDLGGAVWTVPGERMKGGREHRVPLTPPAVALLKELPRFGPYVFPGASGRKHISNAAMSELLKGMRLPSTATVHGFRSTFRDWAKEVSPFPRELAEAALAHLVGDDTERAYSRGDALAKRRELMSGWADYLGGGHD